MCARTSFPATDKRVLTLEKCFAQAAGPHSERSRASKLARVIDGVIVFLVVLPTAISVAGAYVMSAGVMFCHHCLLGSKDNVANIDVWFVLRT